MKRGFRVIIVIIVIAVVLIGGYLIYSYFKNQAKSVKIQGKIKDTALSAKVIILTDKENKEWNITVNEKTKILNTDSKEIELKDLIPQFEVEVLGKETIENYSIAASQIKILTTKEIIILSPTNEEVLLEPKIRVRGYARTTEGLLYFKINTTEKGIIEMPEGAGKYSYFEKDINLSNLDLSGEIGKKIIFSIYEKSLNDGSEINKISLTLEIGSKNIFLYFSNIKFDPDMIDCSKVYPVSREVHMLTTPLDVMHLLLQGPTEEEKEKGYTSPIPEGVKINEISISDGIAKIDFSNLNPGGSCRVAAIRAEITETLKQFPEVKEVIISVDGNIEEALQP